ncbi:M81 family metallopeptidase [Roseitranquillus sediminis]|uniref:M81 family metallopeptidase n=1 Tax=Roseitranquillus sediminis TaxID=2809051 RepID=UPI001D0C6F94|nr:M81 family metallopeptidase [Roseitranquillus sediminis]MBM9594714.1 M81 family metallopeptidase [Roseitranquillus sediminis]
MKRVAIVGYFLEVNSFSPVTTEAGFRALCHLTGDEVAEELRKEASVLPLEVTAFARALDELESWEPVPISVLAATPGGPVEQAFYDTWLADVRRRLEAAGPLDGIYVANHGAGAATQDLDSDGTLYALVRDVVGPGVPIVATLDLHANVSERMVDMADVMITYRTNPHVDQRERAEEAARAMVELWAGVRPETAFIRLPICPPSITLLTSEGPYADLIRFGQEARDERILNVSIFGNFTFSDLPKNGITVLVTARGDRAAAQALCLRIAEKGWAERHRYQRDLTSIDDAVAGARARSDDATIPPRIYADVADNPGSGGSGRNVSLLEALHAAGATGVVCGVFHDPALAAEAHSLGEGATFEAVFNRDREDEFVKRFSAPARVLKLHDGTVVGRRGNRRGRIMPHGPSCLLELGGICVAVSSNRLQTYDPAQFEMFGVDVAEARTVVVKSRGHFRAGFDEFFPPDRIDEIDAPGLSSPVLSRFPFRHLPRPVYPLDEGAMWAPPAW